LSPRTRPVLARCLPRSLCCTLVWVSSVASSPPCPCPPLSSLLACSVDGLNLAHLASPTSPKLTSSRSRLAVVSRATCLAALGTCRRTRRPRSSRPHILRRRRRLKSAQPHFAEERHSPAQNDPSPKHRSSTLQLRSHLAQRRRSPPRRRPVRTANGRWTGGSSARSSSPSGLLQSSCRRADSRTRRRDRRGGRRLRSALSAS
jgi:hypothetical protein